MRKVIKGRSIRWDEARAEKAYADGHWVRETLLDALARELATTPTRPLLVEGDVILTPELLDDHARRLAREMLSCHPAGSVISVMLPNWHEALIIYVAATMAGMVVHPVLPSLRANELRYMLADVNSRMIFIPENYRNCDYPEMLNRALRDFDLPPEVVVVRGKSADPYSFEALVNGPKVQSLPELDADAVRMIMYTSGTTGSPKGVMHTHNSIHALIRQIGDHWKINSTSRFLVASPISHIGGSIYAFETPLILGATTFLMEHWDPELGVDMLISSQCTHFAGATPFLSQTLAVAKARANRLPDLEVFICGGASVPPSLILESQDYFEQARVSRVYGSTEVPVTTIGALDESEERFAAETDGRAGIAQIKLESGEVFARGPQMLVGYVHAEDESEVFDAQGYYRTGDLGSWVNDRYLVISGRSKDIIIRNGENIAPKEIEDLVIRHLAVNEIAVVGIPNDKTGEQAVAIVVVSEGKAFDLPQLFEFLVEHEMAKFKIPERLECWAELPKNDAGKVLKHKIRQQLLATDTSEAGDND